MYGEHLASPVPDEELLSACLRGEAAAWDTLIERYAPLIYSIPLKYGLPDADAADVFQSVCVTLFEKLGTIRDPKRLPAWIITTTTRESWATRKRSRRLSTSAAAVQAGDAAPLLDDLTDPGPLPEEELLALERQALVRVALERLSTACQKMLTTLFNDRDPPTSYLELAERLGMPPNSIGPTRARCLNRLRALVEASGYFG